MTAPDPAPPPVAADTLLWSLFADDPEAARRLAALHPVFEPENARAWNVPDDASLADVARAANLPLDAALAAARGVIGVPELCGCRSGGKGGCG